MKKLICISFFFLYLLSCTKTSNKPENPPVGDSDGKLTVQQIEDVVSHYIMKNIRNPILSRNNNVIRIQGDEELYVLEAKNIATGMLDADEREDAVVSCIYERTGSKASTRHFVLLNKDSLAVITAVTSLMEVIAIADGVLYAELSTRPEDDPGRGCVTCVETLRYKVEGDSLVKIE